MPIGGKVLQSMNLERIDFNLPLVKLFALILVIVLISFILNFLLSHSILRSVYRFFVAPGIIIHELSHALFCLLTGARITKLSMFEKDGGQVEHKPSKIPILGQFLISMAPFAVGFAVLYIISARLGLKVQNLEGGYGISMATDILNQLISNVKSYDYKSLILFYVAVSAAITMVPSTKDFKNIILFIIGGIIIGYALVHYNVIKLSAINLSPEIFGFIFTVISLLILSLILSIIIFVVSKFFKPA